MAKLLIVEDNEMNRDMLSRRLQRRGFATIIATDGGAGLAMARTEHPDLILMDMSLPVIDGWEASRQLKADPVNRRHPHHRADRPCDDRATVTRRSRRAATITTPNRWICRDSSARSMPC